MEDKKYCSIKASYPLLEDSKDEVYIQWAVLSSCGLTHRISIERGQKLPKKVVCCGSSPENTLSLENKHVTNKFKKIESPSINPTGDPQSSENIGDIGDIESNILCE